MSQVPLCVRTSDWYREGDYIIRTRSIKKCSNNFPGVFVKLCFWTRVEALRFQHSHVAAQCRAICYTGWWTSRTTPTFPSSSSSFCYLPWKKLRCAVKNRWDNVTYMCCHTSPVAIITLSYIANLTINCIWRKT